MNHSQHFAERAGARKAPRSVMMSGQAHIEMAVRATRLGALDFFEKPPSTEKLLVTVENALKLTRLETENRDPRARVGKHTLVSPVKP
jgi:two-component system, NtrC family, nitrogen regulation response regulator NtrX